ncbi:MAG TPA: MoxR family ATPase [Acidimicrobiales bacterium]|nr:MoxR family ATPase [Acidimicrobiales bacterium]
MTGAGASGATPDLARTRKEVAACLVGRERELRLLLAALAAGRDVLLEGPPGTSKSTLLREVTRAWGVPLELVEGNSELTTPRLVGHHNPARVLQEDFTAATFVPGPLVRAMTGGGFLYVEEVNRAPEDTLNALLAAIAEREVVVPRVGRIRAADGFRVVASMNPFDNVGTSRISASVHDRLCRIAVGYQGAEEELGIVELRTGPGDRRLAEDAVALARATRHHPQVRQGSSVRGAIDLVLVARQLLGLEPAELEPGAGPEYAAVVLDAALVALSGRVRLHDTSDATAEDVIREIWEERFYLAPHRAAPG